IGGEASLAQFRASLPKSENSDKHTLTILQALGRFRDAPSAPAIRGYLKHQNEAIRLSAAWALAMMADAESAPGLLSLVDNANGWERLQAMDCSLTLAGNLEADGKNDEATKLRDHVKLAKKTPDPVT
ncbi:MAG: HEAT repeat domain-containing protein, partial [Verrucomicrobiales bacterium]